MFIAIYLSADLEVDIDVKMRKAKNRLSESWYSKVTSSLLDDHMEPILEPFEVGFKQSDWEALRHCALDWHCIIVNQLICVKRHELICLLIQRPQAFLNSHWQKPPRWLNCMLRHQNLWTRLFSSRFFTREDSQKLASGSVDSDQWSCVISMTLTGFPGIPYLA